jgi:hypothetical protein
MTKKVFKSLESELEEMNVEGWRAIALTSTLKSIQKMDIANTVRLLPLFDAYVLGLGRDLDPLLPATLKNRVYRPQGWISAVVLVDGRMKGVWEYKTKGAQTTVKISMFASAPCSLRQSIEAEAERLGLFLRTKVVIEYEVKP